MDLRLLVATERPISDSKHILLNGKYWQLLMNVPIENLAAIPPFICISYVWGGGREENPFYQDKEMSDRTLPALEAAMRVSDASAYWIDAFCIPPEYPQKRIVLESMGFIYSLATEVIVSLGSSNGTVLTRMIHSEELGEDALDTLESDKWIESVWTYQEVVNSKAFRFVAQELPGESILGLRFLNYI